MWASPESVPTQSAPSSAVTKKLTGISLRLSGAQTNLGEVLSIKPGQSAVRSHPKESIPGLRDGIYFVVGQALFDGEIAAQIAACLRIKRQRLTPNHVCRMSTPIVVRNLRLFAKLTRSEG